MVKILSMVNEALIRLGKRTDAADVAGGLHAKVAELRNTVQKPRHLVRGSYSTSVTTSYQTGLSITGEGSLKYLVYYGIPADYYDNIKVTIDGVVFEGKAMHSVSNDYGAVGAQPIFWSGHGMDYYNFYSFAYERALMNNTPAYELQAKRDGWVDIPFTTSLVIQVQHLSNNAGEFIWIYEIE